MASRIRPMKHEPVEVAPRKRLPLKTRRAVLAFQSDFTPATPTSYATLLFWSQCVVCRQEMRSTPVAEFDHILPLELGGSNEPENIQGLCVAHHKIKTAADVKRIAKARRQKKHHETGRGTKRKGQKLKSRPFDKTLTKGFDGKVRRK